MKILLVQPARWTSPLSSAMVMEPLGMEAIAAMVIDHHDVKILDMRFEMDFDKVVREFEPDVLGATVITADFHTSTDLFKRAKEINPEIITIAGGPHAILVPEDFSGYATDLAVATEGEEAFQDVIHYLDAGKDLAEVPGLVLFRDGQSTRTPRRQLMPRIGELPLPARHLTAKYRPHYFRGEWKPLAVSYTERGCAFSCTFCSTWLLGGAAYRTRGVDTVIRDLQSLDEDFVFMAEDDSMYNREYSNALADAIIESGIKKKYQFYSRSDHIVANPDLYAKWKKAGMGLLLIGMEMATDDDLDKIHKENTIENNAKAAKFLDSIGAEAISYFMVDPLTFTEKEFDRLTNYVIDLGLSHPIFFIMTPLPGTVLYTQQKQHIVNTNYDFFDFYHCVFQTKLPLGEFYQRFINLYKDCYGIRNDETSNQSAFSGDVIRVLVQRLEKEYDSYIRGGLGINEQMSVDIPPPVVAKELFPEKYKLQWSR